MQLTQQDKNFVQIMKAKLLAQGKPEDEAKKETFEALVKVKAKAALPTALKDQPASSPLGIVGGQVQDVLKSKLTGKPATPEPVTPVIPKGHATPEALGMTGEGYDPINKENLIGAAKSIPDTIFGASEMIQKAVNPLTEAVTGETTFADRPEALKTISEPTNEDQQAGFDVGQIAQFFVPGTGALKVEKGVTKGASLLQKILSSPTTAKVIKEGAQFGGLTAAQEGEVNKASVASGVLGGSFPLLGKLAEPVAKFVSEKIPSKLMNSLIKTPSKEFSFGKNPGLAVTKEGISGGNISELAKNITSKKSEVGALISESAKSGTGKANAEEIINKVTEDFVSDLTDPQVAAAYQGVLDQLFHKVKFQEGKLIPIGTNDLTKLSGAELHQLQQKIGELTRWTGQAYDKPVNKVLSKMYGEVGALLEKVSPGTKELQQRYANLLGAQKSIEKKIAALNSAASTGLLDLGAFGIGAGLFGGDTTDRGIAGVLAALLRRGAGSTLVKSNVSKALEGIGEKTIPSAVKSTVKAGAASLPSAFSKDSQ